MARAPVVLVLVTAIGTHVGGACVAHQDSGRSRWRCSDASSGCTPRLRKHTSPPFLAAMRTCCPQPLQSVPKGKWFCPTHAGTHASFPAFAVVTARTTHEEPISTRTEPVGARGDAHGAATTAQAALDSATQNGTDLRDSGEASGPSDSDEDSESDSDADDSAGLPVWIRLDNPTMGTCPICSERRRLQWSPNYGTTHTVVAVCGRCHSYHEHNDRILF